MVRQERHEVCCWALGGNWDVREHRITALLAGKDHLVVMIAAAAMICCRVLILNLHLQSLVSCAVGRWVAGTLGALSHCIAPS